jgi:rhodanese-related sulfurtransferase
MRLLGWLPIGTVPELAPAELHARLGRSPAPQVVDVRTAMEFAHGHIEGAVSVPVQELPRRLDALGLDPARPVVAICLSAHRSIPAVRLLRERGFDAFQLAGGMLAWRAARLPERR